MKKRVLSSAVAAALALCATEAQAEKCKVVKDGKGMIKKGKGDCGIKGVSSCQTHNPDRHPEAWIKVDSKETCNKLNDSVKGGKWKEGIPGKYKNKVYLK